MSTQKVAHQLGWSASTLNRIENGGGTITSEDVSALLVMYEATGQERNRLLELATPSLNLNMSHDAARSEATGNCR
ncbi:MAG: helix-turn-helix domain-containing protein [Pseudonocardiales bacterium]|nr:helix-turn-helix domain-containing protein [Pseudonocardiales bacterium]